MYTKRVYFLEHICKGNQKKSFTSFRLLYNRFIYSTLEKGKFFYKYNIDNVKSSNLLLIGKAVKIDKINLWQYNHNVIKLNY